MLVLSELDQNLIARLRTSNARAHVHRGVRIVPVNLEFTQIDDIKFASVVSCSDGVHEDIGATGLTAFAR